MFGRDPVWSRFVFWFGRKSLESLGGHAGHTFPASHTLAAEAVRAYCRRRFSTFNLFNPARTECSRCGRISVEQRLQNLKMLELGIENMAMMPAGERVKDYFSHVDMGFLNRRLAITALGPARENYMAHSKMGNDHFTTLHNDHLLVTLLIDVFTDIKAPSLAEALAAPKSRQVFMGLARFAPCPEVYNADRVSHEVQLDFSTEKPVYIAYHTSHIVSDTGRMILSEGGHPEAVLGLLHDRGERFEIEPIVIGAPWLDHVRNESSSLELMFHGYEYGEILPEDIQEFSAMETVEVSSADEWMAAMRTIPEEYVKKAFANLLREPVKADWGGEENDHFSANITVGGRRKTAAFLLKGPTNFREMTPSMCGKNADQIYRLSNSGADVSIVQHSHLVGSAVRATLRAFIVQPGDRARKFCVMDGQVTYRILKAYGLLPVAT